MPKAAGIELGTTNSVIAELNAVTYDVVAGPDGVVRFPVGGKQYAPEEISALVLRKLADDAGSFGWRTPGRRRAVSRRSRSPSTSTPTGS
jgi:molecular chaperone DnaK (HSP70)